MLSDGNVVEYDTPQNLLQKQDDDETAIFKKMVNLQDESANARSNEKMSVGDGVVVEEEH